MFLIKWSVNSEKYFQKLKVVCLNINFSPTSKTKI